ncbi:MULTISPECIES: hypothetical protein [unclassified Acinetobacter]|uniref:hypothetical protein n=1 Tax=unclassified Acinetobacter TaxID=196816 RepID=UPI00244B3CB4|nr:MULTISPECIES: hypothetical protein [unclassified Acinetobacter]MDH0032566.1 hypothetical protein [Acinetobacter sp. GD04021]MDH0885257.1 hypothetical protein [Acinetobacter sp. GD03873]MDH1084415.1 hypothetical protein [Acinetobacter sp. GD03983]MDH2188303.1 hypothetical protein [Acinetobacter sp. GD03645]MDH2203814.1 hypothetical protein [Acinetobacter sp. GD03647]
MYICYGGDLDGQVIKKEGMTLKASEINPDFTSEYYKQLIMQSGSKNKYYCWIETNYPFSEACDNLFQLVKSKNGFDS